eukprot:5706260-Amphidinium_carterae.1
MAVQVVQVYLHPHWEGKVLQVIARRPRDEMSKAKAPRTANKPFKGSGQSTENKLTALKTWLEVTASAKRHTDPQPGHSREHLKIQG